MPATRAKSAPFAVKVHRLIDNPNGDGSKVQQVGTATERDGKLNLLVHGMGAFGDHSQPVVYRDKAALKDDGWEPLL